MPNWCSTRIIFHGDKWEIEDFHKKIEEWTSRTFTDTDFGESWLGNILYGVGLEERIDHPTNSLRCRGWLIDISEVEHWTNESIFTVDTETAWGPMLQMWKAAIDELLYLTIGFSYQAEEPGWGVYEIYDPYGDFDEDDYISDIFLFGEDKNNEKLKALDGYNIWSESCIYTALQPLSDNANSSLDKLITLAENFPLADKESYIYIHKYNRVDAYSE